MATPDATSRQRLARLVIQRRVHLDMHKIDAANAAGLTITTYMRVESGLPVRDVTYAKVERALEWAPGACAAILEGISEEAQPAGDIVDGVRYAPATADGVRSAVQDAVLATMPETPAGKMAELSEGVLAELRKRGMLKDPKSSRE